MASGACLTVGSDGESTPARASRSKPLSNICLRKGNSTLESQSQNSQSKNPYAVAEDSCIRHFLLRFWL